MNNIIASFNSKYTNDAVIVLKGSDATKDNFINCLKNNPIEFLMQMGSEYNDPDAGHWAGTAFSTYNTDKSYITANDIMNTSSKDTLNYVILAGCRMFSNNTFDSLYPQLTQNLPNLKLYSSGLTEIDIQGGSSTYRCFVKQLMKNLSVTGHDLNAKLQTCAQQNDPYITGSATQKPILYLMVDDNLTLDIIDSEGHHTTISNYDIARITSPPIKSICITLHSDELLCGDAISADDTGKKYIEQLLTSLSPRLELMFEYDNGSVNQPIKIRNVYDEFPVTEQQTGVRYGLWSSPASKHPSDNILQTIFYINLTADPSAQSKQCRSIPKNFNFTIKGNFVSSSNNKTKPYQPMILMAESNGQDDDSTYVELSFPSNTKENRRIGFYQVGRWEFESSSDIPDDCVLKFMGSCNNSSNDDSEVCSDVGGRPGTSIDIQYDSKR